MKKIDQKIIQNISLSVSQKTVSHTRLKPHDGEYWVNDEFLVKSL